MSRHRMTRTQTMATVLAHWAAGGAVAVTATLIGRPAPSMWVPVVILAAVIALVALMMLTFPFLLATGWYAGRDRQLRIAADRADAAYLERVAARRQNLPRARPAEAPAGFVELAQDWAANGPAALHLASNETLPIPVCAVTAEMPAVDEADPGLWQPPASATAATVVDGPRLFDSIPLDYTAWDIRPVREGQRAA